MTKINVSDQNIIIRNKTYVNLIVKTCLGLGISMKNLVHMGQKYGSFNLEINEDNPDDLQNLGNWDPKMQEKHYSQSYQ